MNLNDNIRSVKGVGPAKAQALSKLNIETVEDLLMYFPRSYDVYMPPVPVRALRNGYVETVEAVVTQRPKLLTKGSRKIVTLRIQDGETAASLVWFNQPYVAKTLEQGTRLLFRGRISGSGKSISITQPEIIKPLDYMRKLKTMQPVYHLTEGLSNNFMIKLLSETKEALSAIDDYMTPAQRRKYGLISRSAAIEGIHSPIDAQAYMDARRRLVFDEFARFAASMRRMHEQEVSLENQYRDVSFDISDRLISQLPYKLTGAQERAIASIKEDMTLEKLSTRLLQGDVGCGKTIVALYALVAGVSSGHQACILAPTEVLARQHYEDFVRELTPYGIETELLVGSLTRKEKDRIHARIEAGEPILLVGTHALLEDRVHFKDLACAVIDEQHRFGVRQRETFVKNGLSPYVLVMSATPIPRSLAMVLYTDMKVTIIDEMPACRLPIKNCVISSDRRPTAFNFILKEKEKGHQAYIICPMIEESEELDVENVTDYSKMLRDYFDNQDITIGCLHGKLRKEEKEAVLDSFYNKETDILVSTTVVEVGVNVPNATVMMIENSERFGLAQLHQLRGRVGRGADQSFCIFIKGSQSEIINERLDILVQSNDGMLVAQKDLELRGPGDFFGVRQSGDLEFKLGDISSDADIYMLAADYITSLDEESLTSIFTVKNENIVI